MNSQQLTDELSKSKEDYRAELVKLRSAVDREMRTGVALADNLQCCKVELHALLESARESELKSATANDAKVVA